MEPCQALVGADVQGLRAFKQGGDAGRGQAHLERLEARPVRGQTPKSAVPLASVVRAETPPPGWVPSPSPSSS